MSPILSPIIEPEETPLFVPPKTAEDLVVLNPTQKCSIDFSLMIQSNSNKGALTVSKGQFVLITIHTNLGSNLFYKAGEFKVIVRGQYHYQEFCPKTADLSVCMDITSNDVLYIWVENYKEILLIGKVSCSSMNWVPKDFNLENDIPKRIFPASVGNTQYRYYFFVESYRNFEITYSIISKEIQIDESVIGPLAILQDDSSRINSKNIQTLQTFNKVERTISAYGHGWWVLELNIPESGGFDEICLWVKWGNEPPQIQGQKAVNFRTNDPLFAKKQVAWKLADYSIENATYMIWMNNTLVLNGAWTNLDTVGIELTNQTPGEYNYRIRISDGLGLNNTADTEVHIEASLIFSWGTEKYEMICMSLAFGPIALVIIRDLLVKHLRKKYADEFPEDTSGAVLMTHAVGDQGSLLFERIRSSFVSIKNLIKRGIQGLCKLITKYRQQHHSPDPQQSRQDRQEAL